MKLLFDLISLCTCISIHQSNCDSKDENRLYDKSGINLYLQLYLVSSKLCFFCCTNRTFFHLSNWLANCIFQLCSLASSKNTLAFSLVRINWNMNSVLTIFEVNWFNRIRRTPRKGSACICGTIHVDFFGPCLFFIQDANSFQQLKISCSFRKIQNKLEIRIEKTWLKFVSICVSTLSICIAKIRESSICISLSDNRMLGFYFHE